MDNHMETDMENEMETAMMCGFRGLAARVGMLLRNTMFFAGNVEGYQVTAWVVPYLESKSWMVSQCSAQSPDT